MEFASCVLVTKVDQHMDSMAQSQKGWNSHQNVRCVRAEKKQRKNCVTTKCGCMEEHQSCPQKNGGRRRRREECPEEQVVVPQVEAHVPGQSRKQKRDQIKFNTEGNEKAEQNGWQVKSQQSVEKLEGHAVCSTSSFRKWRIA